MKKLFFLFVFTLTINLNWAQSPVNAFGSQHYPDTNCFIAVPYIFKAHNYHYFNRNYFICDLRNGQTIVVFNHSFLEKIDLQTIDSIGIFEMLDTVPNYPNFTFPNFSFKDPNRNNNFLNFAGNGSDTLAMIWINDSMRIQYVKHIWLFNAPNYRRIEPLFNHVDTVFNFWVRSLDSNAFRDSLAFTNATGDSIIQMHALPKPRPYFNHYLEREPEVRAREDFFYNKYSRNFYWFVDSAHEYFTSACWPSVHLLRRRPTFAKRFTSQGVHDTTFVLQLPNIDTALQSGPFGCFGFHEKDAQTNVGFGYATFLECQRMRPGPSQYSDRYLNATRPVYYTFDNDMNITSYKFFGPPYGTDTAVYIQGGRGHTFTRDRFGNYYFIFTVYNTNQWPITRYNPEQCVPGTTVGYAIAKLDPDGNQLWYHTFLVPGEKHYGSQIFVLNDDSLRLVVHKPFHLNSVFFNQFLIDSVTFMSYPTFNLATNNQAINSSTPIKIYPNPSAGILQITGLQRAANLQLFDIRGREVWQQNILQDGSINLPANLSNGLYLYRLMHGDYPQTGKLVLMR